jgi:hypothetical protein
VRAAGGIGPHPARRAWTVSTQPQSEPQSDRLVRLWLDVLHLPSWFAVGELQQQACTLVEQVRPSHCHVAEARGGTSEKSTARRRTILVVGSRLTALLWP